MRALLLVAFVILSACGRPLTVNERAFLNEIQGDTINSDQIRLSKGLAFGEVSYFRPARPRVTCSERVFPPAKTGRVRVAPGAMAAWRTVYFREDLYQTDFLEGYPEKINLWDAMLFAHEMVHIWQWQNRDTTGYRPLRGAGEHINNPDPYLFDPHTKIRFLDHGYEQQGAIVEEYVCCRALAPNATRTKRLHALLSEAMDITPLNQSTKPEVILPWQGVKVNGICD